MVYPYRYYAAQGGLLSYGVNNVDLFRQAAPYIDRILRGAKPSDLPVQQPTRFQLVINAKTAKALANQGRGRVTELRVTIVVALGLVGVVALWLLAVLVVGGFNLP